MNNHYEVHTQFMQSMPILPADLVANAVFELGEPVQSLDGMNGFITEVSADGTEGNWDVGAYQVYSAPVVLSAGNKNVGTPIYYNPGSGALTDTATGKVFGLLVRTEYDQTFPIAGGVTATVEMVLVNTGA